MISRLTPLGKRKGRKQLYRCLCGRKKWIFASNVKRGLTTSCGCYHKERISALQKKKISGNIYGLWTVLDKNKSKKGNTLWLCKCRCGKQKWVHYSALSSGQSKSCGTCLFRLKPPKVLLHEKRFGRLIVLDKWRRVRRSIYGLEFQWLCKCTCGNDSTFWYSTSHLKSGGVLSCGCLKIERISFVQHNRAKHKLFLKDQERLELEMKAQTFPNNSYKYRATMIRLLADRNRPGGSLKDEQIAQILNISKSNVFNIRARLSDPNYQTEINRRNRERWETDHRYRFEKIVTHQIKQALKRNVEMWRSNRNQSTRYHEICGCTFDFLRVHLENQFLPDIS